MGGQAGSIEAEGFMSSYGWVGAPPPPGVRGSLRRLHLANNAIGPDAAAALTEAIIHFVSLEDLQLYDNPIGPHGAERIAKALDTNKRFPLRSLLILNLGICGILDHGTKAISDALLRNDKLTHLDLSDNEVSCRGAMFLGEALTHNTVLKKLRLTLNKIGPRGFEALEVACRTTRASDHHGLEKRSLEEVDLSANPNLGHAVNLARQQHQQHGRRGGGGGSGGGPRGDVGTRDPGEGLDQLDDESPGRTGSEGLHRPSKQQRPNILLF